MALMRLGAGRQALQECLETGPSITTPRKQGRNGRNGGVEVLKVDANRRGHTTSLRKRQLITIDPKLAVLRCASDAINRLSSCFLSGNVELKHDICSNVSGCLETAFVLLASRTVARVNPQIWGQALTILAQHVNGRSRLACRHF